MSSWVPFRVGRKCGFLTPSAKQVGATRTKHSNFHSSSIHPPSMPKLVGSTRSRWNWHIWDILKLLLLPLAEVSGEIPRFRLKGFNTTSLVSGLFRQTGVADTTIPVSTSFNKN